MLYLIATPIGNLGDLSYRAVEVIPTLDYLLSEDTRVTGILLKHYKLSAKLVSYHRFSEAKKEEGIIADLKAGMKIGLVSDRGTPTISDPGQRLVARCRKEGIEVTGLPGACAAIDALAISGFPSNRFQFLGFLPKRPGRLKKMLIEALDYPGTSIIYESAVRVPKTLALLKEIAPDREIGVARELTKRYEEVSFGLPKELKGECVILIPPGC